jgi:hypothetical protein
MVLADIDPVPWAAWTSILVAALTVGGLILRVAVQRLTRLIEQRLDKQDGDMAHLTERLTRELGPNSGGLRETVNRIAAVQGTLVEGQVLAARRMDEHLEFHAGDHR